MRWALGEWSPWISHMGCVLIGFAIPHLTTLDYRPDPVPTGYLLLTRGPSRHPSRMHAVSEKHSCRYSTEAWRWFELGGTSAIGASLTNRKEKAKMAKLMGQSDLEFRPEWKTRDWEVCQVEPKITYSRH